MTLWKPEFNEGKQDKQLIAIKYNEAVKNTMKESKESPKL